MNYELDFWLSKRKDLECAMIRKYIYSKKEKIIYSRGFNNKLLPPSVWSLSSNTRMYDVGYYQVSPQQKAFTRYSKKIHQQTGERSKVEEEISKILNSKELTFKMVSHMK